MESSNVENPSTSGSKSFLVLEPKREEGSAPPSRESWGQQGAFILSCLGYAIGFGNLWRFPYLCYKNGGAIFLIPYFTMLVISAVPLLFLELTVGQYVNMAPNLLFQELSPLFSGVGWAMMTVTFITSIYFNMIFGWSLFYTFSSFSSVLPWTHCDGEFNSIRCFTFDDLSNCSNGGLFYFNKSCLTIEDFCAVSQLGHYNTTHCLSEDGNSTITAQEAVRMTSSTEEYYKYRMLGMGEGISWDNMGTIRWELVGCLALAWTITCLCLIRGIKYSGRVVYLTVSLPLIMLAILLVRGLTLKGAMKGIEFFLMKVDFSKLSDIQVWVEAATQIFYSLSCSFGGFITFASYNAFNHNCMRDAIIVGLANSAVSVFGGFVIFSILGFMASNKGVEVPEVVDFGSGLIFIAYPEAVALMPVPTLWAILFFLMFILLGIDSQFGFMETLLTGIYDFYPSLRERKPLVVSSLCLLMFLLGLTMCLQGGVLMFELLNYYSGSLSILFIAISEIVAIVYVYGYKRIIQNLTEEMNIKIPRVLSLYWSSCWLILTPGSLTVLLLFSVWQFEPLTWNSYLFPPEIQTLGWLSMGASMVVIPIFAIYAIFKNVLQKLEWSALISPSKDFVPRHLREDYQGID